MTRQILRPLLDPALWMRFLMESVVIVGSILFAFAIDAWWQERLERGEEEVALAALGVEFSSNIAKFRTANEFHINLAADISKLIQSIDATPNGSTIEVDEATLISLTSFLTREAATGSLNTLLASGKIDLIQNPKLQQELAEWLSVLEDTREDEVGVRNYVVDRLIPELIGYIDLAELLGRRTAQPLLTGGAYRPGETSHQLIVNATTRNLVAERYFLGQLLLRSSSRRLEVAEATLARIENELIDHHMPDS